MTDDKRANRDGERTPEEPGVDGAPNGRVGEGDSTEAIVSLFHEAAVAAGVPLDRPEWRRGFVEFFKVAETESADVHESAIATRIADAAQHAAAHCPLRVDVLTLTPAQAVRLVRPGAPLALLRRDAQNHLSWVLIADQNGHRIKVNVQEAGEAQWMTLPQFCEAFRVLPESVVTWMALQPMYALGVPVDQQHDDVHAHPTPLARLLRLLRPDHSDITVILVYALAIGLLALSTPIAVEALVNTVAFGQLLQPVVVLAIMLAVFLGFAAVMRALQTHTAEIIQRRMFVRLAGELAHRLPRVRGEFWQSHYGPELINRFFEVVTVQKVTAQLLLDGTALLLQTIVGMAVIAFYHPVFLGFDLFLLTLIAGIVFVLGRGAVATAIDESRQKYATAAWLEEIARSPFALSAHEAMRFAVDRTDRRVTDYLVARAAHFRILMRQVVAALALQVVASTVLLGLGGWLVVRGELSLGQLVAAELIVTVIVGSFAKIGKHLEGYYDLMAAVEKLGHLLDMPVETPGEVSLPKTGEGVAVRVLAVSTIAPMGMRRLENFSAAVEPGEIVALTGGTAQLRAAAVATIAGRQDVAAGRIEIAGLDLRRINRQSLRARVALVKHIETFTGTISDNIHLGRATVCEQDISDALRAVGLLTDVLELQQGANTVLVHDGGLSRDQRLRLMLARAIAGRPNLLLIDGALDAMPDEVLPGLLANIRNVLPAATIVVATGRRDVAAECERQLCIGHTDSSSAALESSGEASSNRSVREHSRSQVLNSVREL
jgi:ABC-type bacteriocin/lantibiotic exporter with double-glycine peptidase domain